MSTQPDEMKRRAVGNMVRSQRERTGLTIAEAARAARLSRTTWTEVEQAAAPMKKPATLGKMARTIDLEPALLFAAAGYIDAEVATPPGDGTGPTPSQVMELLHRVSERLDVVEQQLGLAAPARSDPSDRTAP